MATGAALLRVEGLSFAYSGAPVLSDVSMAIGEATMVGLIGPNGAGKSTLVECISGGLTRYQGRICFAGVDTTRWPSHRCASVGLVRTFQTSRVFPSLTSMSNVMVGMKGQYGEALSQAVFGKWKRGQTSHAEKAAEIISRYGLNPVGNAVAGSLSGGQRRLLEIARALSLGPRLLILDEPFAGVSPVMRERIRQQLLDLRKTSNLTVLMIEHRLELVEELCDEVIVLANGRTLARGSMADLRKNPAVLDAYLGVT